MIDECCQKWYKKSRIDGKIDHEAEDKDSALLSFAL